MDFNSRDGNDSMVRQVLAAPRHTNDLVGWKIATINPQGDLVPHIYNQELYIYNFYDWNYYAKDSRGVDQYQGDSDPAMLRFWPDDQTLPQYIEQAPVYTIAGFHFYESLNLLFARSFSSKLVHGLKGHFMDDFYDLFLIWMNQTYDGSHLDSIDLLNSSEAFIKYYKQKCFSKFEESLDAFQAYFDEKVFVSAKPAGIVFHAEMGFISEYMRIDKVYCASQRHLESISLRCKYPFLEVIDMDLIRKHFSQKATQRATSRDLTYSVSWIESFDFSPLFLGSITTLTKQPHIDFEYFIKDSSQIHNLVCYLPATMDAISNLLMLSVLYVDHQDIFDAIIDHVDKMYKVIIDNHLHKMNQELPIYIDRAVKQRQAQEYRMYSMSDENYSRIRNSFKYQAPYHSYYVNNVVNKNNSYKIPPTN